MVGVPAPAPARAGPARVGGTLVFWWWIFVGYRRVPEGRTQRCVRGTGGLQQSQWLCKWRHQKSAPCPPPPLFLLRTRLLLQLTQLKLNGGFLVLVQLNHNSYADCTASAAAIYGHDDYDGPVVGCSSVSALLPFGGESATNWGIRW